MMSSQLKQQQATFNLTTYQANVANRWKFLEKIEPDEAPGIGFLLLSPIPVLVLSLAYILFVRIIGPALMSNREAFQLKILIRLYNLVMVLLAAYLFHGMYDSVGSFGNLIDCQKTFTFADQSANKTYHMGHTVILVRISEYLDTIFFTLRKKQNQVTFLHVFHHVFVPIYAYWVLRTAPLRFNVYILLVNSLIHILMYFYYFLATFQPPRDGKQQVEKTSFLMMIVTKLLMFKKYMTQLQILQFISLGIYTIWAALQPNRCNVPWTYIIANFLLAFGFLSLFLHFYINVYKTGGGGGGGGSQKTGTKRD